MTKLSVFPLPVTALRPRRLCMPMNRGMVDAWTGVHLCEPERVDDVHTALKSKLQPAEFRYEGATCIHGVNGVGNEAHDPAKALVDAILSHGRKERRRIFWHMRLKIEPRSGLK